MESGNMSDLVIKVSSVDGDVIEAYCFTKRGPRLFKLANNLAFEPLRRMTAG
jgi:hypothetical protein